MTADNAPAGPSPYQRLCRAAAAAFALVAAYTVAVKAPAGGLAGDTAHTVLHVVTGALAAVLGWADRPERDRRWFAAAIAVGYGTLGVVGWFIPGVALDTPLAVPLAAADNVFHLTLGAAAVATLVAAARSDTTAGATSNRRTAGSLRPSTRG